MASTFEEVELRTELLKRDFELEDCSQEISTLTDQLRQQRENTRKLAAQLDSLSKSRADYSYNSSPELRLNYQDNKRPPAVDTQGPDWFQDIEYTKSPSLTVSRGKSSDALEQANYRYSVLQKKLSLVLTENKDLRDKASRLEQEVKRLKNKSPPRRTANEELLTKQVQELTASLRHREELVGQLEGRVRDLETPTVSRIISSPMGFISEETLGREESSPEISRIEDRIMFLEHKVNRLDKEPERGKEERRVESREERRVESRPASRKMTTEYRAPHNYKLWQEVSDEIQRPLRSSRSPRLESKLLTVKSKVKSTDSTLSQLMKELESKNSAIEDLKVRYEGLLTKYVDQADKRGLSEARAQPHSEVRPQPALTGSRSQPLFTESLPVSAAVRFKQPLVNESRSQQLSPRTLEPPSGGLSDRRISVQASPQPERRTTLLSTELARRGLMTQFRGKLQRGKR
jgi:hypothetical protein